MATIITADQSRQARRELSLSQADVAEATGLKRQYLSEYEGGSAQRFTASQLRKLRSYYESKIAEAVAAGDDIALTFGVDGDGKAAVANPVGSIENVKAKRFFFPVADEISDETLSATLATIRANDIKLSSLLTLAAEREEAFFGEGDFTEDVQQAFRDAFSLLAVNYLMVRAVGGWPEIGLSASNESLTGNTVLAAIVAGGADLFEQAKLPGMSIAEQQQEEGVEL